MLQTITRIPVANYSNLKERTGYSIQIDDKEIALFKTSKGTVYALENRSPHPKGGVLSEGLVSGDYVFCPVYDWKISLVDGEVQAPDSGQVKIYKIEIEKGIVFVVL
ncbi:nitrite reductase small subunit NirD [Neobacillus niacini]|uniref:nitrite reductase small subunit NirD n=1 Tax=Neobacillus niacini TaxID=86668 RepID=UPI0021CB2691|nr:nitrite reductase small subunit NirD [Neobacillus niacini]MCM3766842.1 nitrite reductase small subunit NirD [Neobacillus niacini]